MQSEACQGGFKRASTCAHQSPELCLKLPKAAQWAPTKRAEWPSPQLGIAEGRGPQASGGS
eukprot:14385833-Alexandrium_andersonii.AAC.1